MYNEIVTVDAQIRNNHFIFGRFNNQEYITKRICQIK